MLTRRRFLGSLALVAAGVLGACGRAGHPATPRATDAWPLTVREPLLPSPMPAAGLKPTALVTPELGGVNLEAFLRLSAVLTGFDDLNPVLGQVYLASLQSAGSTEALAQLYERTGFSGDQAPTAIADLEAAGVYDDEAMAGLADRITEYWYSGVYGPQDDQQVATYVDALVWKAMTFTKPRTVCGPYEGFWREHPPVIP
jgi:hypothetical protein